MKTIRSDNQGFTLIESVIALLILSSGLLGLAQLFVLAISQNAYGRQNTMAVSVAGNRVETLRNEFNNDLRTGISSADMTAGNHGPVTVTLAPPSNSNQGTFSYNVSWTVAVNGFEKEVTVVVTPGSSNVKLNRNVQLVSHFAP